MGKVVVMVACGNAHSIALAQVHLRFHIDPRALMIEKAVNA